LSYHERFSEIGVPKIVCQYKEKIIRDGSGGLIAQLGERKTEDLKVPSSILGQAIFVFVDLILLSSVLTLAAMYYRRFHSVA
jgi:hypothetical protein